MKKRLALSKVEFDVITIYADFNPDGGFTQLYHYTNADAKQKIVDGKKLDFQLTKTDAFLDKNEGTSILEPYYHACGHLYETGKIDLEFFLIARSITAQMLRDHDIMVYDTKEKNTKKKKKYVFFFAWQKTSVLLYGLQK